MPLGLVGSLLGSSGGQNLIGNIIGNIFGGGNQNQPGNNTNTGAPAAPAPARDTTTEDTKKNDKTMMYVLIGFGVVVIGVLVAVFAGGNKKGRY